jgi:hypothetical protein
MIKEKKEIIIDAKLLCWTNREIEAYFGHNTAHSDINVMKFMDWPFGDLTCEEAKAFRDLLQKIKARLD